VGGILSSLCTSIVFSIFPTDNEGNQNFVVSMFRTVFFGALSGTIGASLLLSYKVDLGGIDVLHATRAGALGGTIIIPGSILLIPVLWVVMMAVYTPLWLSIQSGAGWTYVRAQQCIRRDPEEDIGFRGGEC
jgi:hypothetical protein